MTANEAEPLPPGIVEVSESGAGKFQQNEMAGRHRLIADEPADVGGMDSGPGPYDLLLASLGTCTAMTIRLYAARKAIALAHVSVRLGHERVHGDDAAGDGPVQLERITRDIRLEGVLTPDDRARLMQIADRCPVHRTLTGRIEIRTREVSG